MGNRSGCCFRKDINMNLEFNAGREDYMRKLRSKDNLRKISKVQATWKASKLRDKLKNKLKFLIRKRRTRLDGNYNLEDIRPEVRELKEESKPYIHPTVKEIIANIGPFMLEERETNIINSHKLFQKEYVIMENNVIYRGSWNTDGDREGYGELFFTDGSLYEGFFKEDKMNGRGRIINILGDFYEGDFLDDKAHGFGKYISAAGVKYIGYWENDRQHGKGDEIYPDGSRFEGQFVNGDKQGFGKFLWQDGSCYEGNFVKNVIQGKGKYRWKDGRIYKGDWVNNKMEGHGIFTWPDGKKYIGNYKDDKKSGEGVFYWPDGKKYEGSWLKGKQNGYGIMTINNISRYGEWRMGQKIRWINECSDGFEKLFPHSKSQFKNPNTYLQNLSHIEAL